jgi:uncharacterized OsmC-like protein
MSNELYVDVKLMNEKVKFSAVSNLRSDREIIFDYVPPIGDGEGFLGLEALLISFAGCVSTTITGLLRRMGNTVTHYEIRADAIRNMRPLSLEKIHAVITLNSDGIKEEDVQKVIEQAEAISPVWLAIKNNVEVTIDYKFLS